MPFTPLTSHPDADLSPPSRELLEQRIVERMDSVQLDDPEELRLYRRWFIDELRSTAARSVACGQEFSRVCRACYADAPDRRSICANEKCRELVCRDCADKGARCPRCGISTDYMALFEEESRECPICQEMPFCRSVFANCGHIVCLACTSEMYAEAGCEFVKCPFCRVTSEPELLLEEIVNKSDDIEAVFTP